MPIRIATLRHKIEDNGARLHLAMLIRAQSRGADAPPSEEEQALLGERRTLKEARATRQAQAKLPKVKAVRVVKQAVPHKAKVPKAAKPAKEHPKAAKGKHLTRTELHAKKAEALAAAKKASRKSAKT